MDVVDKATRSRMMSGIRSKDTKPELAVRRFLHRRGFRYTLHDEKLPGRPDLALPKYRTAIFVHGCFWHRHPGCRYTTTPRSNEQNWQTKFEANVSRDAKNLEALRAAGWTVIIIWECGLREANVLAQLEWLPDVISRMPDAVYEWPACGKDVARQRESLR